MKKYMIALYIRLSLEDAKTDSMSISSQRSILREYASALAYSDSSEAYSSRMLRWLDILILSVLACFTARRI